MFSNDKHEDGGMRAKVAGAVSGYMLCSASMLLVNKLAVHFLPAPAFVLLAQFVSAAVAVRGAAALGFIEVDPLEWAKVKVFMVVAFCFVGLVFANIKVLQYSNVDTFIVFRASTPLVISVADYMFLGRELPSLRSFLALLGLLVGTAGYVLSDKNFEVKGYMWIAVWYFIFAADQIYIKYAVGSVQLSNWGRVFYTNLLATVPLLLLTLAFGEIGQLTKGATWTVPSTTFLLISCAIGTAMSYFQFLCRYLVSATSFTVLGNVCKVLTIVVNCMIWDKHSNMYGLMALFLSLGSSAMYQQAPMRQAVQTNDATPGGKV
jgi:GDP-mannose transporter